jgi:hypothetical protein
MDWGKDSRDGLANFVTREPVGEKPVCLQQSQQKMFRFDGVRPKLARFEAGEENGPPSRLCVSFEHKSVQAFADYALPFAHHQFD